jgi:hypothetical protein
MEPARPMLQRNDLGAASNQKRETHVMEPVAFFQAATKATIAVILQIVAQKVVQ